MNKMEKLILAVPRQKLFPEGAWEGLREVNLREAISLIEKFGEYRRRGDLEWDPSWLQIIPQIILIVGNELFIHQVPPTGNDSRLHGLFPIFFGGHVEEEDGNIETAGEREFIEESGYEGKILKKEFIGMVNLEDNSIDRVHTGLVWAYIGDSKRGHSTGDDGIVNGRFVDWKEAEKLIDRMSYWSRVAFPVLKKRFSARV